MEAPGLEAVTHLLRVLLAIALSAVSCGGRPAPISRVAPNLREAAGPLVQPYVLVVTGPKPCPEGVDLTGVVQADADYVTRHLRLPQITAAAEPGPAGQVLISPSSVELEGMLAKLRDSGRLARGLVFLFTGHGVAHGPKGQERSALCLSDGAYDAARVPSTVQRGKRSQSPWLAMILNACSSAYVDISAARFPTAVLAASPSPFSVHPFSMPNRPAGSCRAPQGAGPVEIRATPFVVATTNVLAEPSSRNYDRNEDGIVTVHELFHVILDATSSDAYACVAEPPDPKFQLQARGEVPVRFHRSARDVRAGIQAILDKLTELEPPSQGRDALLKALRSQLDLEHLDSLPEIRWNFVVTESDTVRMFVSTLERAGPSDQPCWGHPTALALAPSSLTIEEQRVLGRFSMFTRFFEFSPKGDSVDVIDLLERAVGRETRIGTYSPKQALVEVPSRIQLVGTTYRALSEVPQAGRCERTELYGALANRAFFVCPEQEGQCFKRR
jgi:hypothetical protein